MISVVQELGSRLAGTRCHLLQSSGGWRRWSVTTRWFTTWLLSRRPQGPCAVPGEAPYPPTPGSFHKLRSVWLSPQREWPQRQQGRNCNAFMTYPQKSQSSISQRSIHWKQIKPRLRGGKWSHFLWGLLAVCVCIYKPPQGVIPSFLGGLWFATENPSRPSFIHIVWKVEMKGTFSPTFRLK